MREYVSVATRMRHTLSDVALVATQACGGNHVVVSMLDSDHEHMIGAGLYRPDLPLQASIAAHIKHEGLGGLAIADIAADARFAGNMISAEYADAVAYVGVPIYQKDGAVIGVIAAVYREAILEPSAAKAHLGRFSRIIQELIEGKRTNEAHDALKLRMDAANKVLKEKVQEMELSEKYAGLGYWRADLFTNTLYWSEGVFHIHGLESHEYTPEPDSAINFYHPEDQATVKKLLATAVIHKNPYSFELRIIRHDGEERLVYAKGECQLDNYGNVKTVYGIILDVTERRESEKLLQQSNAFLRSIMDHNPNLVFVKDSEFRIVAANQAFLSLYPEDKRDKVIGYTTIEDYQADEAAAFLEQDKIAFERGRSVVKETITFPDGKQRILQTEKVRFEDDSGAAFIFGTATDITEQEMHLDDMRPLTDA